MVTMFDSLGGMFSTAGGMLEIAKNSFRIPGIGLSGRARATNLNYLNSINGLGNKLMAARIDSEATPEALGKQILALRARLSQNQLAPSLRDDYVPLSDRGKEVDKKV